MKYHPTAVCDQAFDQHGEMGGCVQFSHTLLRPLLVIGVHFELSIIFSSNMINQISYIISNLSEL